jgi:hypothetical protein
MQLLYDTRDDRYHERLGSRILYWLDDLGAVPLDEADPDEAGFLFAGARPIEDYRDLVAEYPLIHDRPDEREPLLRLDSILAAVERFNVRVPSARSWVLPLDAPLPDDLTFPLFLRTAETSMKKGGNISRVRNRTELVTEATELRRALGWDATILARQWLDLEPAGEGHYGPVPQEVRVWVVDGVPAAWSFHYMAAVAKPVGFPPTADDLAVLRQQASAVSSAFRSRLVAADFARGRGGTWWWIEAGPGNCAGTAHEQVFKCIASRLKGEPLDFAGDAVGGLL